jgi:hypothetical protein
VITDSAATRRAASTNETWLSARVAIRIRTVIAGIIPNVSIIKAKARMEPRIATVERRSAFILCPARKTAGTRMANPRLARIKPRATGNRPGPIRVIVPKLSVTPA